MYSERIICFPLALRKGDAVSERYVLADLPELTDEDVDRTAALVKVLDSKTRLEILLLLAEEEKVVHQLVTELEKSQPLISQHLRVLRSAGLVSSSRKGREVLYALDQPDIIGIIHELASLEKLTEAQDELAQLRKRRRNRDIGHASGSSGAAIVDPPANVRPEVDPGLAPQTPKPVRD